MLASAPVMMVRTESECKRSPQQGGLAGLRPRHRLNSSRKIDLRDDQVIALVSGRLIGSLEVLAERMGAGCAITVTDYRGRYLS
jgi:hypothetical protein